MELWNSNGSGGFKGQDLGIVNNSWQIAGTGDFNGDGHADILWRNANGDVDLWNSNGNGGFTGQDLGIVSDSWQIAGTGDFNGDGHSDILWRNVNGDVDLWNSNGNGGFTGQDLGSVGNSWKISASGFASFGFVGAPLGWAATKTQVEGNTIVLSAITGAVGTVTISQIPVGDTLIDGSGHSFTASVGNTSISLAGWTLSSLKIVTVNDIDFTLTATTTSGQTAQEPVVVNPVAPTLAPVAETGVEGSAIALNLGASAKNLAGDSNSLATLTVSAIPVGATLSDGVNSFTATAGSTSVSVLGWSLSSLTITPLNDAISRWASLRHKWIRRAA